MMKTNKTYSSEKTESKQKTNKEKIRVRMTNKIITINIYIALKQICSKRCK